MARWAAAKRALLAAGLAAVALCGALASPPEARRRVLLISFDAVAGQKLERLLADPSKLTAGGYRRIAARGVIAGRSVPPTPALTAVSHIVIATGALPQVTGIVSNTMLDRSKPFGTSISGFDAPIRADTLWEAARRQGKRVGVMLYPGADGKATLADRRLGDHLAGRSDDARKALDPGRGFVAPPGERVGREAFRRRAPWRSPSDRPATR